MRRSGLRLLPAGFVLLLAAVPMQAAAPTPPPDRESYARAIAPNRGASELSNLLRKLGTRASLMMVTAHPDDEDGGMLAYESRGAGADVSLLTLNRGEGGQNVMSPSYWDELGLLRTEELLAADRYYGVHQYWTRVVDFGFSKTLEESLKVWGYDRVLSDVVRAIRIARPLVVTSVFTGSVADGHGQHQVAGMMAQEAFRAAGDPKMFPEQIREGLEPWSPLKVYARVPFAKVTAKGIYDYATGHWVKPVRFRNYADNTWIEGVPSTTFEVPEGQFDPIPGLTYFQLGREGLGEQKSQTGGVAIPPPGPVETPYHLYASRIEDVPDSGFFSGIDTSLEGIAGDAPAEERGPWRERLHAISEIVTRAQAAYRPAAPEGIAPLLAEGLRQTDSLLHDVEASSLPETARYNMTHELTVKRRQFNQALVEALGISLLATVTPSSGEHGGFWNPAPTFQIAIPDQTFGVEVHLANLGGEPIGIAGLEVQGEPGHSGSAWKIAGPPSIPASLAAGQARNVGFSVTVPARPTFTRAYFSRPDIEQPYYDLLDPQYLNRSTAPDPLAATATLTYRGATLHLRRVVQTIERVTGPGPVMHPLLVAPAVSVWLGSTVGVIPVADGKRRIEVVLRSNIHGPAKGTLRLEIPDEWHVTPSVADWSTTQEGDVRRIAFEIRPENVRVAEYQIRAVAEYAGQRFTEGFQMVGYTGLRPYPYYRAARENLKGVDVRVPAGLKVAYIMGTGDDVPQSLREMGVHPALLSSQDLASGNLSQYDVVVVGIRAYAVRSDLKDFNWRLLQYVKNGGVLLVQYQTPEFTAAFSAYPLSLGENPEKVVEEHAPVDLLRPDDPLFRWPNQITQADFHNWVEERGHDFLSTWDPRYIALTEVHDTDQAPQKGGLVYARYGHGIYIYSAYAFYRELQQGVPGAFRIFANLLSTGKNPGFTSAH